MKCNARPRSALQARSVSAAALAMQRPTNEAKQKCDHAVQPKQPDVLVLELFWSMQEQLLLHPQR
jgi:hypothetical protein